MIAILGGLGAALMWVGTTLTSARASRIVGSASNLAVVMASGLLVLLPFALTTPLPPAAREPGVLVMLAIAGIGNVAGLLLAYGAFRAGPVGLVSPITSTEGAIAAGIALLAGERVAPGVGIALALVVAGVVVVAAAAHEAPEEAVPNPSLRRSAAYAVAAALLFGVSLYASGRVAIDLPLVWAILPARVVGVVGVTIPLVLARRLRLDRVGTRWSVANGMFEVLGMTAYALGARDGIAVAAVLASQFGVVSVLGAMLLFRERLTRTQTAGIGAVAIGVAFVSALRAA